MIIPNSLKDFKEKDFLLLVSGKQNMHIYEGKSGELEQVGEIVVKNPHYSDNEGHFKVRTGSGAVRSGAVRETNDAKTIEDFIKQMTAEIKKHDAKQYEGIYLSAPETTKKKIAESLPVEFKQKLKRIHVGNYWYESPLTVLERFTASA